MERSKQYITLDEFLIYKEGQIYEGYVIGYGYAFYEALAVQTPYCSYAPYAPPSPMLSNYQTVWQQNLDNTPEAVMESFGEDHVHLLQQLVREQNGEYYVNMGYGEILRVPVEGSIIAVDMNSSGKLKLSVKSVSGSDSIEKSIEIDLESFNTVFNNPNDVRYLSMDSFISEINGNGEQFGNYMKYAMTGVNTTVGGLSTYMVYEGGYYKWNEVWHSFKHKPTAWAGQKRFKQLKGIRTIQKNKVAGARSVAGKLTKVGGVLLVADIGLSGELKPSHAINATMLGVSTTGVGAIIAGVWFIADFGTMGVNYIINGEAKGISDMLDDTIGTYEMYEGFY